MTTTDVALNSDIGLGLPALLLFAVSAGRERRWQKYTGRCCRNRTYRENTAILPTALPFPSSIASADCNMQAVYIYPLAHAE